MNITPRITAMLERHRKEAKQLALVAKYLSDLPEPGYFWIFLWPNLDYTAETPEQAEEIVKAIQHATGIYLQRDVTPSSGNVYFSGTWHKDDQRVDFRVNGGELSPACHLEEEEVMIPERVEMRWKIVCDEKES